MMKRTAGVGAAAGVVGTWAVVWAMPGMAIEALANVGAPVPGTGHVDMWPQTLAIPGIVGGVLFAGAIAVLGRWRSFEWMSVGALTGVGAVVGVLVGGIFMALGWIGGTSTPWEFGFATWMSAISAVGAGLLFRFVARRSALERTHA